MNNEQISEPQETTNTQLLKKYGRYMKANQIIFKEGETGNYMFIIQKGRVKLTQRVKGEEKILMVLGKGDFFGEMAILDNSPRIATATSVEDTVMLALNRDGFINMVKQNANIAINIMDKLTKRLRRADMIIKDLQARDVKSLLVTQFLEMYKMYIDDNQRIKKNKVISELARQVDVSERKVISFLEELQKMDYVVLETNEIFIKNIKGIVKMSSFFKKKKGVTV